MATPEAPPRSRHDTCRCCRAFRHAFAYFDIDYAFISDAVDRHSAACLITTDAAHDDAACRSPSPITASDDRQISFTPPL